MTFVATPAEERFWPKVNKGGALPSFRPDLGPCWEWTASLVQGYGQFGVMAGVGHQKMVKAHRFAYELLVGAVPGGMTLDHLCRNRACVNPAHLEVVTTRENIRRGYGAPGRNARKTHCSNGHPYDGVNSYVNRVGYRKCRRCNAINAALNKARRRAAA